ncbi:hypothetical protein [Acetobacterium malicum]|uniref:hypothetical protein n=1 Tax=Acetobacterium malicum TaxID=52692 RepID=UPI0035947CE6
MISSISQSGSAASLWQAYQTKQTTSSDTSEASQVDGSKPPPKGPPPPPPEVSAASESSDATSLASEQEDIVSSILEEYDTSKLTEEDATAIITALQEAGISESSALADAIKTNGFDLEEIKSLVPFSESLPNGGISQNYMQIRETMGSLSILDETEWNQTSKTNQDLLSLFQQYQDNQNTSTTNLASLNVLA